MLLVFVPSPAVSNCVWSALECPLFGFNEQASALGISGTELPGEDVRILGINLKLGFYPLIWRFFT